MRTLALATVVGIASSFHCVFQVHHGLRHCSGRRGYSASALPTSISSRQSGKSLHAIVGDGIDGTNGDGDPLMDAADEEIALSLSVQAVEIFESAAITVNNKDAMVIDTSQ